MKILLATDGSKYSAAAAQKAITWIHSQGVEVLVLQVLEPLIFSTPPQMARDTHRKWPSAFAKS